MLFIIIYFYLNAYTEVKYSKVVLGCFKNKNHRPDKKDSRHLSCGEMAVGHYMLKQEGNLLLHQGTIKRHLNTWMRNCEGRAGLIPWKE